MKVRATAIVLSALLPLSAFSTEQIGDFLIYNYEQSEIDSAPLESYFTEDNPRPDFQWLSTACYRGYIGCWKIEDDMLYLVSLNDMGSDTLIGEEIIPLDELFPGQQSPIPATWYSGVIRVLWGAPIPSERMGGICNIYECEIYLTLKNGKVIAKHTVDNLGQGAILSSIDLLWVFQAVVPVEDDGDWIDARLIHTDTFSDVIHSGKDFLTRGIYFDGSSNRPPWLWIPNTHRTNPQSLELDKIPENTTIPDGTHVEIKGHFTKTKQDYEMHVESVRELLPGETIHHPGFRLENEIQTVSPKKLVARTENIILAEAVDVQNSGKRETALYEFHPIETLKGNIHTNFTIHGDTTTRKYLPNDFNNHSDPHFWIYQNGRCSSGTSSNVPLTFTKGMTYLVFLDKPYHYKGFEEIHDAASDAWLREIRKLIRIASNNEFIAQLDSMKASETDIGLSNKLTGTWAKTNPPLNYLEYTFSENGTYSTTIHFLSGKTDHWQWGGPWSIKNGYLVRRIKSKSLYCPFALNLATAYKVIAVTNDELTYQTSDRELSVMRRRETSNQRVDPTSANAQSVVPEG